MLLWRERSRLADGRNGSSRTRSGPARRQSEPGKAAWMYGPGWSLGEPACRGGQSEQGAGFHDLVDAERAAGRRLAVLLVGPPGFDVKLTRLEGDGVAAFGGVWR